MHELTPRRLRVLRSVVEEFVATAQPISSDAIARGFEGEVSSATVRNELAVLEDAGLIAQPHTSAGRVPTDRGYRLFVERLMGPGPGLPLSEQRTIRHQFYQVAGDPAESAHLASAVLARSLHSAAVATSPATPKARLRRVELVPLQDDVVLVTLILQSGGVRQVVQHLGAPVSRDDLSRLSNEISTQLLNKTAGQARRALGKLGDEALPFVTAALRLLQQAEEQSFAGIYFEGLTQLLGQPEFAQSKRVRPIFEVLEQQPLVARLLAESLAAPGVQVIIGAENSLEQMREASVVLTRYGRDEDARGVLGVVGPTRLPYWRVVPMVRFMAELMEVLVQDSYGRGTARPRRAPAHNG